MTARSYLLVVLTSLSAFNQLDRQLMSVLLEPIRHEFVLSDVQLGLLSGFAFAVLYAGLSMPAAIWAVHHGRRNLVAASAVLWGAMTAVSGLAQSFWQLLLGRIGTGAGEAGAMPGSHAMISDLYAPHERATAMAVWSSGVNIGIFLAFLAGGYVGQRFGWRVAFAGSGIGTIAAALVLQFTTREPKRAPDQDAERLLAGPSTTLVSATLRLMWNDPVLRHTTAGATITAIVGYGSVAWLPSFLVRAHQLDVAAAGAYFAVVIGIGGAAFAMLTGRVSDVLRRHDVRWSLWVVGVAILAAKPLLVVFCLTTNTALALATFVLPGMIATVYVGPALAVLHNRLAPTLRPTGSAVFLMIVNLIGIGVGPLLIGMMSQWVFAASGMRSLAYALLTIQVFGVWGAAHFLAGGRRLGRGY